VVRERFGALLLASAVISALLCSYFLLSPGAHSPNYYNDLWLLHVRSGPQESFPTKFSISLGPRHVFPIALAPRLSPAFLLSSAPYARGQLAAWGIVTHLTHSRNKLLANIVAFISPNPLQPWH
jgi:hypothetical protein